MFEFRHILFPIDFSERCKEFRHLVQFVANQLGTRLTLLHVVPVLSGGEYGDLAGVFPSMEDFTAVEERMRGLLSDFLPGGATERTLEIVREVSLGDPAVVIADYAANHHVDLIMMPTHGYGRFRSLLMGSVASKVLHDAPCPVWTAAHVERRKAGATPAESGPSAHPATPGSVVPPVSEGGPEPVSYKGVKTILAAVDLAEGQIDVIGAAADLGRKFDAKVTVIHAVPAAEHIAGDTGGDEFGHFLLHAAREHIDRLQAKAQTKFDVRVEPGGVPKTIRKVAQEANADLVVLGRGVVHAPFGRLRSKAYEIIRESPCPVLSL